MNGRIDRAKAVRIYLYTLFSFLPALPALLWFVALPAGYEPLWGTMLSQYWDVSAGILLLTVTVADSVISGAPSKRHALSHLAWVVAMAAVVAGVLQAPNRAFLLGLLFFIHSWRSLPSLWCGENGWWLWPAWARDSSMAILLFLLSMLLPEVL